MNLIVLKKQFEFLLINNKNTRKDDWKTLTSYEYTKLGDHLGVNEYISFVTSNAINKII